MGADATFGHVATFDEWEMFVAGMARPATRDSDGTIIYHASLDTDHSPVYAAPDALTTLLGGIAR